LHFDISYMSGKKIKLLVSLDWLLLILFCRRTGFVVNGIVKTQLISQLAVGGWRS